MKAISSAIFSMSEQQAVFEQENSCREARPMAGEAREGTSDRRDGIPGVTGLPGHTSFGDRISRLPGEKGRRLFAPADI